LEVDDHNFKAEKHLPGSFNRHQPGGLIQGPLLQAKQMIFQSKKTNKQTNKTIKTKKFQNPKQTIY